MTTDEDVSTDDGKRKKSSEGLADIFTRSKRSARTPDKSGKREEKLDQMMEMMQALTIEVKEIRKGQELYREEINRITEENRKLKEENVMIKKEMKIMKDRLDTMERDKRSNNVVIQGLKVDTDDRNILKEAVKNFMDKELEIDVKIEMATRLGERTCLVKLKDIEEKEKVMRNKSKLKNCRQGRIYIDNDMTENERSIQGKIRTRAREERRQGKNVRVGYQKLTIGDVIWRWNRETEQLDLIETDRPAKN